MSKYEMYNDSAWGDPYGLPTLSRLLF